MTDRYTKFVLTVIAAALVAHLGAAIVPATRAQSERDPGLGPLPPSAPRSPTLKELLDAREPAVVSKRPPDLGPCGTSFNPCYVIIAR